MTLKEFVNQSKEQLKEEMLKLSDNERWGFERDYYFLKGQYSLLENIEEMALEGLFNED